MISEDASVSTSASTEPRYRYYEAAPETIAVPVSELMARLPAEYRLNEEANFDGDHQGGKVALPCRELFTGNTPRLPLGILHDLLPDLVRFPEGADRAQHLSLPAGWLALYFQLITKHEELPPEPGLPESSSAPGALPKAAELSIEEKKEEPAKDVSPVAKEPERVALVSEKGVEAFLASEGTAEVLDATAVTMKAAVLSEEPEVTKKRGFFASLPIFRRHAVGVVQTAVESEPEVAEASIPSTPTPEIPVLVATQESPGRERLILSPVDEMPENPNPPEEKIKKESGTVLTMEPLWKIAPHDQIEDPTALQSLFMTEEKLTLERVIAMAGKLPGLRACVLATGDQVLSASATPTGVDLRTLSGQAMTLLSQLRDSSSSMGIGAVPAITLHAQQGIVSFLYQGELCLLVLHADRGFVPGVRERLQEMLGHLSSAKALPGGTSLQPSLPI